MSTPQAPLGTGYGARTAASEVIDGIDLTGKLAVVTGGYSGIGLETVRAPALDLSAALTEIDAFGS